MLHFYFLSSLLTLSITYSWYSLYGYRHSWGVRHPSQQQKRTRMLPGHAVSKYMWDIYNSGLNFSEADVVKGICPKVSGSTFNTRLRHRGRELEFVVPEAREDEVLVKAEVRVTRNKFQNRETFFQIYLKADKWIFLEEKKVSDVDFPWTSFHVTHHVNHIRPGIVTFLILTVIPGTRKTLREPDFFHPVLLLSYSSPLDRDNVRRKRSPGPEDYEEKTNRIWQEQVFSREDPEPPKRARIGCRRKPMYIKFSEIDYDSWIVAPSGYEAFQCAGRCGFPVGDHLSPTKHAILQTLVHDRYPWKAPRACCVPTKLDPISVLYVDENGVLTYRFRYRDMVVAECGCR